MDGLNLQSTKKIKFIAYFSYFFAATQLMVFIGGIMAGVDFLNTAGSLFNVGIWSYIGYALVAKRQRTTYWIAVAFLIYIVLSGLGTFAGFYFLLNAEVIDARFLLVIAYSLIIFIGSVFCLYILGKRDVRNKFTTLKGDV